MKYNKFDNHAKETIGSHETPIDTEALWNNVQAELYPKSKKKFIWAWFSASSILAVILFSGYIYTSGQANTPKAELSVPNTINTSKQSKAEEANSPVAAMETVVNKNLLSADVVSATNKKNPALTSKQKTKNTSQAKTTNSKIKKNTTNKITKIYAGEKSVVNNSQTNTRQIEYKTPLNTVTNTTPREDVKKSSITPTVKESNSPGAQKIKAKKKTNNEQAPKVIAKITETKEAGIAQESSDDANDAIHDTENNDTVADNAIEDAIDNAAEDKADDSADNAADGINRKLKRDFQLGLGFRVGIANSLTTLSANSDTDEFNKLRNLRSESESNLETIDLGIDVLLKHKSGVYLSTGVDYLKVSRKLEFNSEIIDTDSVMGISNIFVNPITMDTTFEEGLIERTTTTFTNKEVYNNLHIVNIPVSLGATLNYEQWVFGVQGGVLLNILVNHKGQIRDSESTFYDLKTDESNWFKDNFDLSYQGAALIGYNFSDNFQIIGGPNFRSTLVISEDINPVKQSQVGLGLQVSARYWFD